jgi:Cu2+-containing amine oxidase
MAATEQVTDLPVHKSVTRALHPLCPLSASEITRTADLVRSVWPEHTDLRFKIITLLEPAKKEFIPYLDAEISGKSLPAIERKAFVAYYIRNTVRAQITACRLPIPSSPDPWAPVMLSAPMVHLLTLPESFPRSNH